MNRNGLHIFFASMLRRITLSRGPKCTVTDLCKVRYLMKPEYLGAPTSQIICGWKNLDTLRIAHTPSMACFDEVQNVSREKKNARPARRRNARVRKSTMASVVKPKRWLWYFYKSLNIDLVHIIPTSCLWVTTLVCLRVYEIRGLGISRHWKTTDAR